MTAKKKEISDNYNHRAGLQLSSRKPSFCQDKRSSQSSLNQTRMRLRVLPTPRGTGLEVLGFFQHPTAPRRQGTQGQLRSPQKPRGDEGNGWT